MAKEISTNTLSIINKIVSKGDPIPVVGTTQSGKSTAMGFMAASDPVRDLLSMREAEGKGSTIETNIVVTNSDQIDKDTLYVQARMVSNHIATCTDDNLFLAKILHFAIRKYDENGDNDAYIRSIRTEIMNDLADCSNDSLGHKIKSFSQDGMEELIKSVSEFPVDILLGLFVEAKAVCEQKYQPKSRAKAERRVFRELLTEKDELIPYINGFWDCYIKNLDKQAAEVLELLKENGAVVSEENGFTIALGEDQFDSLVAKTLLDSESESKEFLFEDMSLIFRGNDKFFEGEASNLLTVTEQDGKNILVIRLIDNMGMFHTEGATSEDELERVVTILSDNHADKLLLVINGHVTDTVKDGNEAIKGFLRKIKRSVGILILFTHWDENLLQEAKNMTTANRRSRASGVDWEAALTSANEKQKRLVESFEECLKDNTGKANPYIAGVFTAAILTGDGSKSDQILESKGIDYDTALLSMVETVLGLIKASGSRIKVKEGMKSACVIVPDNHTWDVKTLFRNMVVDCKGTEIHKYWPASVRAVRDKWRLSAMNHDSDIKENNYNYMNIHSNFVIDMRNLAMNILNNSDCVQIDVGGYIVGEVDKESVKADIINYLKDGQAFGKKFAKLIGADSFEKGFKKNDSFCYQYQRLRDMLQYTQDYYFSSEKVSMSGDESEMLLSLLQEALQDVVKEYMDAKCIEVY